MFHDLFTNIAILVSFLLIVGQIFKRNDFNIKQSYKTQALLGLAFGALGIILMLFTIQMTNKVIIDLRNIPIICAGIMGGPIGSLLSGLMIALFRIIYFGVSTASACAFIVSVVVGIGTAYISVVMLSRQIRFTIMFLFAMLISNIALIYLLKDSARLFVTLSYYWPVYIFGAVLAYFTCEYIISANSNYIARKEAEQKLTISSARFKAIFDNAGIGIVVRDCSGKLMEANPAYLEMVGCSKEEVEDLKKVIHPDDIEDVKKLFENFASGKLTWSRNETRYLNNFKQVFYTDVTTSLIPGSDETPTSIIRIVNNITEQKKTEESLRESEERFRTAFDNAAIGMCLSSLEGKFLKVNNALCDLLGYTEEELVNTKLQQITYPDDHEKDISLMRQLLNGKISHFYLEKRYVHKNGKIIWGILSTSIVYDSQGRPLHLIGQVQDITLMKQTEEELKRAKLEAEKQASTDYLTGILNRRAFIERLRAELDRVEREDSSLCLIMADIDHFKKINDNYGHNIGDQVLQQFTLCLEKACRSYDFIGRYGGEEFVICLPATSCEHAYQIAERMRQAVQELKIQLPGKEGTEISITSSFGVTNTEMEDSTMIDKLISSADEAMYKAKIEGRNKVHLSCENKQIRR